jgi:uncharacterized protein YlaI
MKVKRIEEPGTWLLCGECRTRGWSIKASYLLEDVQQPSNHMYVCTECYREVLVRGRWRVIHLVNGATA